MAKGLVATIPPHGAAAVQIPKWPNWYTLPQQPVSWIQADYRIETDVDVNGVGRVRVKPGYNINIADIRYGY